MSEKTWSLIFGGIGWAWACYFMLTSVALARRIKRYEQAIRDHNKKVVAVGGALEAFNSGVYDDEIRKQTRAGAN